MIDEFRHRTRLDVRLGDLDPFGHVNNAVIASYVEQGRVVYLRDVLGTGADPVSMPFILAMLKIDYLSQVMFSDAVEVGSRVDWIGNTSIGMSHLLVNQDGRQLAKSDSKPGFWTTFTACRTCPSSGSSACPHPCAATMAKSAPSPRTLNRPNRAPRLDAFTRDMFDLL